MKKQLIIGIPSVIILFVIASYFVLKNTPEFHIHNMRGANNVIYLHKDGHKEAVYDENGNLVTDCINMASYNYGNPGTEPFKHFFADTLAWISWGNCKDDPTSMAERASAYSKDLGIGIKKTFGL